jgi:hypothetical protein
MEILCSVLRRIYVWASHITTTRSVSARVSPYTTSVEALVGMDF